MENLPISERVEWIDCAKLIAICAVAVDHCNGFLYTNQQIAIASYFSVSLFVLLAGITAWKSHEKKKHSWCWAKSWKKSFALFSSYAVAVLIYQVYTERFLDIKRYRGYVLSFNTSGPFYFVLVLIQLLLIAPVLISWVKFCNAKVLPALWHIGSVLVLCVCCSGLIRYTYVLAVHGGGQYILGGTYLLLYYLGILFESNKMFLQSKKTKLILLIGSVVMWVVWWQLMAHNNLPFDKYLERFLGIGFNPPSINLMVFAIITLLFCYAFFSSIDEIRNKCLGIVFKGLCYLGSKTWYIFLYHLLVKTILVKNGIIGQNIWTRRIIVFSAMIIVPAVLMSSVQFLKNKARHFINEYCVK